MELLGIAVLYGGRQTVAGGWAYSFTMLTLNADQHAIFKELHRPDPKRPPEHQDKRMVAILPRELYDAWLDAPADKTMDFMRMFPANRLQAHVRLRASPDSIEPSGRVAPMGDKPLYLEGAYNSARQSPPVTDAACCNRNIAIYYWLAKGSTPVCTLVDKKGMAVSSESEGKNHGVYDTADHHDQDANTRLLD